MRKIYYHVMSSMAIVALCSTIILSSCKKETENLLDLDMSNITKMTESQKVIYDEAIKRIDPYVAFEDGKSSCLLTMESKLDYQADFLLI